ncbi:MAG: HEAT repeat domain-containing protein, partial [Planctomycetes bacterium]|nr:HEAT repeat domain-containing protein [Planctomycetota bacterium]
MTINMEVSANQLFNVREAKRAFGLIGSGPVMADIVGGACIPIVILLVGSTENLVFVSMSVLVGSCILFMSISRRYRSAFVSDESEDEEEGDEDFKPLRVPYLAFIALSVVFAQLAYYLVDYQLMTVAESRYAGKDEELAAFFGLLFASVGVLKLLLQLFVTNRLINRLGTFVVLGVLPLGLVVFSGVTLFSPLPLFAALVLLKGWDDSFRYTFNSSAMPLCYQVFPVRESSMAQNAITGKVDPFAVGASGLILMLLAGFVVDAEHVYQLSWLLLFVAAAWFVTVVAIKRRYLSTLTSYLSNDGGLGGVDMTSPEVVAELFAFLNGSDHEKALQSLKILLKNRPTGLLERLPIEALVSSEHEGFKVAILNAISTYEIKDEEREARLAELIAPLLQEETPIELHLAAIEAYCAVMEETALPRISPFLQSTNSRVRAEAVFGLVRWGGLDGILIAGPVLRSMVTSDDEEQRYIVAAMIGEAGMGNMRTQLLDLLEDPDLDVRRTAIESAAELVEPRLYPHLIASLGNPRTQLVTRRAIALHIGDEIIPLCARALRNPETSHLTCEGIVRLLGMLESEESTALLVEEADTHEEDFRIEVLRSLSQRAKRVRGLVADTCGKVLELELAAFADNLQCKADLANADKDQLLEFACDARGEDIAERIWMLLSLMFAPDSINSARLQLKSSDPDSRAAGLELLDTLLDRQYRDAVLLIFDDLSEADKLRTLHYRNGETSADIDSRLKVILSNEQAGLPSWLRVCAYAAAQERGILSPEEASAAEEQVLKASFLKDTETMKNVVECIIFLRTIPWFSELRDDFLARIAEQVSEHFVRKGTEVIKEGEIGDFMYIIKKGRVEVKANGKKLVDLEKGAFFGEMAVLDAE